MIKYKKSLIVICIFISLLLIGATYITYTNSWPMVRMAIKYYEMLPLRRVEEVKFAQRRELDHILNPTEMIEDLQQLEKDLLEVHPSTEEGLPEELEKAFTEAYEKVQNPLTVFEFGVLIAEVVATLQDAHTDVSAVSYVGEQIPLQFKIMDEQFIIVSGLGVREGDILISVGGVPMENFLETYMRTTSAENKYWPIARFENRLLRIDQVKLHGGEIITSDSRRPAVKVVVEREGEHIEALVHSNPSFQVQKHNYHDNADYNHFPRGNTLYSYFINEELDYAHFVIRTCKPGQIYDLALEEMFTDISKNGITNLIIDLRGNTGGDNKVVDDLLNYIKIEEKLHKGSMLVRFSEQASSQRGYLKKRGQRTYHSLSFYDSNLVPPELRFSGDIYVLVDGLTYSSGTDFAARISDNKLGTVVGRPTGGMPTSFGDILFFQFENSKIFYTISHKRFDRPDLTKTLQKSLYPDIEVSYTLEDYLSARDLEMEVVIEMIQR